MRRLIGSMGVLLLIALVAGCSGEESTAAAAAAQARRFLEARSAGDLGLVWGAMTEEARRLTDKDLVAEHLRREDVAFEGLGAAQEIEPGVVRVPVVGLTLSDEGRSVHWPEAWLTLEWEGERWAVAWAEPLYQPAQDAYQNTEHARQLELAQAIVEIDPYHYRGHLELHYAYRGLRRLREAELALAAAAERATAAQSADVEAARARFKLLLNAPADALTHSRRALELAAPYAPGTYSARWQAETLVLGGRAAVALGDLATAAALAEQAAAVDPDNPDLAIFRYQLARLQTKQ